MSAEKLKTANEVAREFLQWQAEIFGFPGNEAQTEQAALTLELVILRYLADREQARRD